MRAFPARILILGSVAIILCGFLYDLLFAGIPYQDPTPEMSASYELHSSIATTIYAFGSGGLVIGILGTIVMCLIGKPKIGRRME